MEDLQSSAKLDMRASHKQAAIHLEMDLDVSVLEQSIATSSRSVSLQEVEQQQQQQQRQQQQQQQEPPQMQQKQQQAADGPHALQLRKWLSKALLYGMLAHQPPRDTFEDANGPAWLSGFDAQRKARSYYARVWGLLRVHDKDIPLSEVGQYCCFYCVADVDFTDNLVWLKVTRAHAELALYLRLEEDAPNTLWVSCACLRRDPSHAAGKAFVRITMID
jgi:hypothetical protein